VCRIHPLHCPVIGPLVEQPGGFPQLSGPQLQLAPVEGQDGAKSGLTTLVGQRQQPAQRGARLAHAAAEGKLDRCGTVGRDLIEAGIFRRPWRALGQLLDRMATQDAGPDECLLRMPRYLSSGGSGELVRLGRQRFSFGDPLDPDHREQQRLRRQRGRPQCRIVPLLASACSR